MKEKTEIKGGQSPAALQKVKEGLKEFVFQNAVILPMTRSCFIDLFELLGECKELCEYENPPPKEVVGFLQRAHNFISYYRSSLLSEEMVEELERIFEEFGDYYFVVQQ